MHEGLKSLSFRILVNKAYEEGQHPRWPKGDRRGGKWRPKYGTGGGSGEVVYEIAPNPDNKELTARWDSLSDKEKQAISDKLTKKFTPGLLKEVGLKGEIDHAMGGFEGHMNPSYVIKVGDKAFDVAGVIGDTFGQKAMVVIGSEPANGLSANGAVKIVSPGASNAKLRNMEKKLGDIAAGGWTYHNGGMQILNFSGKSDEDFAASIDKALGGQYTVQHYTMHSAYIEEHNYASPKSISGGSSWEQVRGRTRERFSAALEKELKAVGKAEKAEGQDQDLRSRYASVFT